MHFGLSLPNRGDYGNIHKLVELAVSAEESGWDGFFIWDHYASGVGDHVDPWIAMAAIAANTHTIRLGIHITPLSRRRPWKVAREIVSLDHLSNGRMVLGAGLGDFTEKEFANFGEVSDRPTRGQMLDEALEIIAGLQSGETFKYHGKHYRLKSAPFRPRPVQEPRVPIWVAGLWPNKKPFRRAARWDGVVPLPRSRKKQDFFTPAEVRQILDYIQRHRETDAPFDFCLNGILPANSLAEDRAIVAPYRKAGVTWWIEFVYSGTGSFKQNAKRIQFGPPKL
jgi:alkanesulfonate monooxygenase SsuD/methylene tetrahydromethanopterin reductase-like flavin-dependent oxidoreductase (luciferase family)